MRRELKVEHWLEIPAHLPVPARELPDEEGTERGARPGWDASALTARELPDEEGTESHVTSFSLWQALHCQRTSR